MGLFNRTKKPAAKADEKKEEKKEAAEAPVKAVKKAEKAEKAAPRETGDAYRVLLRPLVTEKTTAMAARGGYGFEVSMTANKVEIKKAVKNLYGVDVAAVRVLRVFGKPVRSRTGSARRAAWRKAYVTLKKGQTIDVFA